MSPKPLCIKRRLYNWSPPSVWWVEDNQPSLHAQPDCPRPAGGDEDSGCCRGLKDAPDSLPGKNTAVSSLSSRFQLWVLVRIPFVILEQPFVNCSSYLYRQMKLGKSLISFKLHLMKSACKGHIGEKAPGNPLALSAGLIYHSHSSSPSSGPS